MTTRSIWPPYVLLLSALAWIFFADVLTLGLDTHDAETFRDHERIAAEWTYFFSPDKAQASGRPVAEAVKFLYFLACGNDPTAFHFLSVAFHLLCSLLLARLALQCGASPELSWLGGLLFLVNIAHFQVVHYISALDYALALSLGLGALSIFISYLQSRNPLHLGAYYILVLSAVFAHLSMVMLLPFSLCLHWQKEVRIESMFRRLAPLALLLSLAFFAQLALASRETSTWNALEHYPDTSPVILVLGSLRVFLWLVSRLLTTAYWLPLPVYTMQDWELYLGGLVCVGLALGVRRKNPWALWTLLGLIPFAFLTETTLLDMPVGPSRYLYLASAGSSVLLAWALLQLSARLGAAGRYVGAVALCIVLLFSYQALKRVEGFAYYTSGRHHIAADHIEKGTELLRRAIAQGGDAIPLRDAYLRLCMALLYLDHDSRAMATEALMPFPDDLMLGGIAAVLDGEDPRTRDRGYQWLQSAQNQATGSGLGDIFKQHLSAVYVNLGKGYLRREDFTRAIDALQWARKLAPERAQIATTLSSAYTALAKAQRKRGEVFEEALKSALEIDAQNTEALRLVEEYIDYGVGS